VDRKVLSGFFYSFSSAMTGTQSVVLGKTLAIIIRNYAAGKIVIFDPLDLFILFFIVIVFLSFLVTFTFWLYRRTESMALFDTVFIAPLNQVMWLTFSTVAGGIYFHEFEQMEWAQWVALVTGTGFNYLGLYHLVPTKGDHPILIINMEKPQSTSTLNDDHRKRRSLPPPKQKQSDDFESFSDSNSRRNRCRRTKKKKTRPTGCSAGTGTANAKEQWIPMEILPPDDSDDSDDEMEESSITAVVGDSESDGDEGRPLLKSKGAASPNRGRGHALSANGRNAAKWYDVFAAKRR